MTAGEIVAIILTAMTGCAFIIAFTLFACFVVRSIKEKPADKLIVGFAVMFVTGILFLFTAVTFIVIVN